MQRSTHPANAFNTLVMLGLQTLKSFLTFPRAPERGEKQHVSLRTWGGIGKKYHTSGLPQDRRYETVISYFLFQGLGFDVLKEISSSSSLPIHTSEHRWAAAHLLEGPSGKTTRSWILCKQAKWVLGPTFLWNPLLVTPLSVYGGTG